MKGLYLAVLQKENQIQFFHKAYLMSLYLTTVGRFDHHLLMITMALK